jgi:hypothetical protein
MPKESGQGTTHQSRAAEGKSPIQGLCFQSSNLLYGANKDKCCHQNGELYSTVCSEKRQVTGARTIPMRTANTVRCVVRHRHRRVPAPVQSADRPAQSRESVLVVSTIMVIAKAHPSLPSDSRSRAHSSHLTSHDGHSENLKSPTARRCELLRRMTSSRP